MEIIISNKQLLELAKINNAKIVGRFTYNGAAKYKFISLRKDELAKFQFDHFVNKNAIIAILFLMQIVRRK